MSDPITVQMDGSDILIGVDGGATKVAAHHVLLILEEKQICFRLGASSSARTYSSDNHFSPVPISEQLRQLNQNVIELGNTEHDRGRTYVQSAADVIVEIIKAVGDRRAWIGIGMPGLKTRDGRGILVMNHGPRIPDYLDQLENQLRDRGVNLAKPVRRLGSDADYCGSGEEYAEGGCFRGARNAYFLGGGSGLAEALKLDGRLLPFDQVKFWMLKAWQMPSEQGPTFEKLIAPKSMNACFAESQDTAKGETWIEQEAERGNPIAQTVFRKAAEALAELVFERICTLLRGRLVKSHHDAAYDELEEEHPYREKVFDRIVIGQILGNLYEREGIARWFRKPFEASLSQRISMSGSRALERDYLCSGELRPELIVVSRLRAAPALGAAIDAVMPLESQFNLLIVDPEKGNGTRNANRP